jgi:hypothetical protein
LTKYQRWLDRKKRRENKEKKKQEYVKFESLIFMKCLTSLLTLSSADVNNKVLVLLPTYENN